MHACAREYAASCYVRVFLHHIAYCILHNAQCRSCMSCVGACILVHKHSTKHKTARNRNHHQHGTKLGISHLIMEPKTNKTDPHLSTLNASFVYHAAWL
jgi:hypothetical protein